MSQMGQVGAMKPAIQAVIAQVIFAMKTITIANRDNANYQVFGRNPCLKNLERRVLICLMAVNTVVA